MGHLANEGMTFNQRERMRMMKKWMLLLLCAAMVLSLAACGGKKPAEPDKPGEAESATGEMTETKYWKAVIPATLVEEDDSSDSFHAYEVKGTDQRALEVNVSVTDSAQVQREAVEKNGLDLHDYADQTLADAVTLGGVYCVKVTDGSKIHYYGRDEARKTDVHLVVDSERMTDEDVKALEESFTLLTEDVGHEDAPYPWDGERLEVTPNTITVGGCTLKAEWIRFAEPITTFETFDVDMAVAGDHLYILLPCHVLVYDLADPSEVLADIQVDSGYSRLEGMADGRLLVEGFIQNTLIVEGTEIVKEMDNTGYVYMSPFEAFGYVDNMSNEDGAKITIAEDGSMTKEPIAFVDADGNKVQGNSMFVVADQTVAIAGPADDDSDHIMGVYSLDGQLIQICRGTEDDPMGSINGYAEGVGYYVGCDANMRDFKIWDENGELVGVIDTDDLLGIGYPWMSNCKKMADGNIYAVMSLLREDESCREVLVYRLTITP